MATTLKMASPQTPSFPVVDTRPRSLFPTFQGGVGKPAFWICVSVVSMGNNTKILVGDSVVQTDGLFSPTDFFLYDVPDGYVFDASLYFIVSDVDNSAVIAVSGMYPPSGTEISYAG